MRHAIVLLAGFMSLACETHLHEDFYSEEIFVIVDSDGDTGSESLSGPDTESETDTGTVEEFDTETDTGTVEEFDTETDTGTVEEFDTETDTGDEPDTEVVACADLPLWEYCSLIQGVSYVVTIAAWEPLGEGCAIVYQYRYCPTGCSYDTEGVTFCI